MMNVTLGPIRVVKKPSVGTYLGPTGVNVWRDSLEMGNIAQVSHFILVHLRN